MPKISRDSLLAFVHYINVDGKTAQKTHEIISLYYSKLKKDSEEFAKNGLCMQHYVLPVRGQETKIECIYPLPVEDVYLEEKIIEKIKKLDEIMKDTIK